MKENRSYNLATVDLCCQTIKSKTRLKLAKRMFKKGLWK